MIRVRLRFRVVRWVNGQEMGFNALDKVMVDTHAVAMSAKRWRVLSLV